MFITNNKLQLLVEKISCNIKVRFDAILTSVLQDIQIENSKTYKKLEDNIKILSKNNIEPDKIIKLEKTLDVHKDKLNKLIKKFNDLTDISHLERNRSIDIDNYLESKIDSFKKEIDERLMAIENHINEIEKGDKLSSLAVEYEEKFKQQIENYDEQTSKSIEIYNSFLAESNLHRKVTEHSTKLNEHYFVLQKEFNDFFSERIKSSPIMVRLTKIEKIIEENLQYDNKG